MLHERFQDALRRCLDGNGPGRGLFRRRVSLSFTVIVAAWSLTIPTAYADGPLRLSAPTQSGSANGAPGAPRSDLAETPPEGSELEVSPEQARASIQWLASLAIEKAPRTLDGDKDWGKQKKRWSGVKMKLDGLRLKTHRRFREVNHGRWMRYQAILPEPGTPGAAVAKVHQVHRVTDPKSGQPRWQIDSSVTVPMKFTARVQRWNLGLKIFSVTIEGDVRVRLDSTTSIDFVADYGEVPPALVIDPRVDRSILVVEHFEVDRFSKVGGDVAEEWGEWMEDAFRDRFLEKQNEKLTAKLNAAIDKERDSLRLSLSEWLTDWQTD